MDKIDVPAWFERALDPSTPTTKDQETMRTASTYVEDLGGEVIYPTIRMNKAGRLFKPKNPLKSALDNGDYILVEGPAGEDTAMKATELSKRMSNAVAQSRAPVDQTDEMIKEAEERMTSDTVSFNEGGVASQKEKANAAFAGLDEKTKEMQEQGITSEFSANGKKIVNFVNEEAKDAYTANDILSKLRAGEITIQEAQDYLDQSKKAGKYAEGGLLDEGGAIDPVSGNDVPAGSLKSEVRDDIDAKLSEGEFVLPADVVRYIGLENLMELRNKAKQGLQQMEDMGQMGNSEEAIMDDTADMDVDIDAMIDAFDPNDPETLKFNVGGTVTSSGAPVTSSTTQNYAYTPAQNIYNPSGVSTQAFNYQPQQTTVGYQPPNVYTPPTVPVVNPTKYRSMTAPAGSGLPEQRQYIGPNGEMRTFTFINGVPTEEIPAGFKVYKAEEAKVEVAAPKVEAPTPDGGGGDSRAQAEADKAAKEQFDGWVTTMNQLSELDPEFAKEWSESSRNPAKGFGLSEFIKGGGVVGLVRDAYNLNVASQKAQENLANKYNLDIDKYKNAFTFFGLDKYNESSLVNDAMATKTIADSISSGIRGVTSDDVLGKIARTDIKLDANEDGKITEAEKQAVADQLFFGEEDLQASLEDARTQRQREEAMSALFEQENEDFIDIDRELEQLAKEEAFASVSGPQEGYDESEPQTLGREGTNAAGDDYSTSTTYDRDNNPTEVTTSVSSKTGRSSSFIDSDGDGQKDNNERGVVTSSDGTPVRSGSGSVVTSRSSNETGGGSTSDTRWCCSRMVHHELWTVEREFARLSAWSRKQPNWWRSGYPIWGKVVAKHLLAKEGFWTDVMQAFYDHHVMKKPHTLKSLLANVIIFPGSFVCGMFSKKIPTGTNLADPREFL